MHKFRTPLAIKKVLTTIYKSFLPYITIIGIMALVVWTYLALRNKIGETGLILICYMIWGLIATRIFLLSMIEISLYKTHAAFYQTSIFPLLILALIIPIAALIQKVKLR
jgi:hypothetical protein